MNFTMYNYKESRGGHEFFQGADMCDISLESPENTEQDSWTRIQKLHLFGEIY